MSKLNWQNFDVRLHKGMSTKKGEQVLEPEELLEARNCWFEENGWLTKMPGWLAERPVVDTGPAFLADALSLGKHHKELLVFKPELCYTYTNDGAKASGSNRDLTEADTEHFSVRVEMGEVCWDVSEYVDRCELNDVVATVYQEFNSSNIFLEARQKSTGARLFWQQILQGNSLQMPRLVTVGTYIQCFFVDATGGAPFDLKNITFNTVDVGARTARTLISTLSTYNYDITVGDDGNVYGACVGAQGGYTAFKVAAAGTLTSSVSKARLAKQIGVSQVNSRLCVARADGVTGLPYIDWLDLALADQTVGIQMSTTRAVWRALTPVVFWSGAVYTGYVFWDVRTDGQGGVASTYYAEVFRGSFTASAKSTEATWCTNSALGTKAVRCPQLDLDSNSQMPAGNGMLVGVHWARTDTTKDFQLQAQLLFMHGLALPSHTFVTDHEREGPRLIARVLPGEAYSYFFTGNTNGHLPSLYETTTDEYCCSAVQVRLAPTSNIRYHTGDGANRGKFGLIDVRLLFNKPTAYNFAESHGATYVSGGILHQYDGSGLWNVGFEVFPDFSPYEQANPPSTGGQPAFAPGLVGTNNASGVLEASKNYSYRFYWEWINEMGEREQSSALTISGQTGAADNCFEANVPTLPYSDKKCYLAVFRRGPDPAETDLFYRVSSTHDTSGGDDTLIHNDPTKCYVVWKDVKYDKNDAPDNEPDYLNAGGVDNVPFPDAPTYIATGQNRIFGVPALRKDRVYYSKLRDEKEVFTFNEELFLQLPPSGGDVVTGVRATEDSVVVFKERAIFVFSGIGPDNLGIGQYGLAQQVSNGIGCIEPKSLIETHFGLVFLSHQGWYLLDPAYRLTLFGEAIWDFNSMVITGAVYNWTKQSLFIATSASGGYAPNSGLVYDFNAGLWSRNSGCEECLDILMGYDKDGDEALWGLFRDTNPFDYLGRFDESWQKYDGGEHFMLVDTGWIRLDGLQGDVRGMEWKLLGKFNDTVDQTVRVRVAYNDDNIWVDDWTVKLTAATYNETNTNRPWTVRKRFGKRKVRSVRFLIEETDTDQVTPNAGIKITGLTLRLSGLSLLHRTPGNYTTGEGASGTSSQ